MAKKKAKVKEKVKVKDKKKSAPLKQWMRNEGITQKELRDRTKFGTGTMNRLVNFGKASKSVIEHLALELGLPMSEMEILLKMPK